MTYSCKRNGFISLPLIAWVSIFAGAAVLFGTVQTNRLKAVKSEYATFKADVKRLGDEAEKRAKEQIAKDRQAKERADAQNKRLRSANDALAASLRESRSRSGFVPAAAPGARSPERATFDRPLLERAIQQLDAGVSGLIAEGDQARIALDTAKEWAK